jgi:hypothetical protein
MGSVSPKIVSRCTAVASRAKLSAGFEYEPASAQTKMHDHNTFLQDAAFAKYLLTSCNNGFKRHIHAFQ